MKKLKLLPILLVLIAVGCSQGVDYTSESLNEEGNISRSTSLTGKKPYPQSLDTFNIVKPNHKTQTQLDGDVREFYTFWKAKYVVPANKIRNGYVVLADGTGDAPDSWGSVNPKSHSEANGYGMIISALMGDKDVFDGLFIMYNKFRSIGNPELMSWVIPETEDETLDKTNSATDGDVDMAYALLLADNQWGSNGTYNYKLQANKMIEAIKTSLFNENTMRTTRGDWDAGDSKSRYSSRSSDWLVAEFQTFFDFTGDQFWIDALEEIYNTIDEVIATDSTNTHLMPDFIEGIPATKAKGPFLECEADDDYGWNACRYPWRVGMGYGHYGDIRSKNALDGFVSWALGPDGCKGDLDNYYASYALDGSQIGEIDWDYYIVDENGKKQLNPGYTKHTDVLIDYTSNAFYSPLVLAATHDSKNQNFINNSWEKMIVSEWPSFFGDSITMQCLLYISGNWWIPENGEATDTEPPTAPANIVIDDLQHSKELYIKWDESTDNVGISHYEVTTDFSWRSSVTEKVTPESLSQYSYGFRGIQQGSVNVSIFAVDVNGNKSSTVKASYVIEGWDLTPPTVPSFIRGTYSNSGSLNVEWGRSYDNTTTRGMKYNIVVKSPYGGRPYIAKTITDLLSFSCQVSSVFDYLDVSVAAEDTYGNRSGHTETIRLYKQAQPVIPEDPAATGIPATPSLSKNNWNGDPNYKVTSNMYWGNNATVLKLYENDILIETKNPSFNSPSAQKVEFSFTGKSIGTYKYKVEAINQHGTTTSSVLTVNVTH